MEISIIIATHRRADQLAKTLKAIQASYIPEGITVEVVVVENGARDSTATVVEHLGSTKVSLRYFHERDANKSKALNRGIEESKGRVLAFLDDDVRPDKDWLSALCSPLLNGNAYAVAGCVQIAPHLLRPWMNRTLRSCLASTEYLDPEQPSEMCGANMAIHREVLTRVPYYDPELGGGGLGNFEDVLFARQIIAAGFPILGRQTAKVEHHFDPARLRYECWLKAAKAAGRSLAYLQYHWEHHECTNSTRYVRYLKAKLAIRRSLTRSFRPHGDSEGIRSWELSYVEEIARCRQFALETLRPRNYSKKGLVKLHG